MLVSLFQKWYTEQREALVRYIFLHSRLLLLHSLAVQFMLHVVWIFVESQYSVCAVGALLMFELLLTGIAMCALLGPCYMIRPLLHVVWIVVNRHYNVYAGDIMKTNVFYIATTSTYMDIRDLLRKAMHNSFALVDKPGMLDHY